jgi:phage-related protein
MADTLIPPRQPSTGGTSGTAKARMLSSKFGDGYKQDSADGANSIERTQTLVWDPVTIDESAAIIAFLDAHSGVPFWYRLPRDQAPRAWIWTSRDLTHPNGIDDALTVSLEERFVY